MIAAAVAAAGIFMYNKITKDNEAEQQRQEQIEQQAQADEAQKKIQEANEAEAKKNAEENQDVDDEEEEETPTPTEEPVATSTPKPLPTATPTATPFPEDTTDDTYYTPDDNDGVVNVSNDGTTGGISNDTEDVQPEATQAPAGVIFVGDSRFRAMANIATDNSDLWECSSTGDYKSVCTNLMKRCYRITYRHFVGFAPRKCKISNPVNSCQVDYFSWFLTKSIKQHIASVKRPYQIFS